MVKEDGRLYFTRGHQGTSNTRTGVLQKRHDTLHISSSNSIRSLAQTLCGRLPREAVFVFQAGYLRPNKCKLGQHRDDSSEMSKGHFCIFLFPFSDLKAPSFAIHLAQSQSEGCVSSRLLPQGSPRLSPPQSAWQDLPSSVRSLVLPPLRPSAAPALDRQRQRRPSKDHPNTWLRNMDASDFVREKASHSGRVPGHVGNSNIPARSL